MASEGIVPSAIPPHEIVEIVERFPASRTWPINVFTGDEEKPQEHDHPRCKKDIADYLRGADGDVRRDERNSDENSGTTNHDSEYPPTQSTQFSPFL